MTHISNRLLIVLFFILGFPMLVHPVQAQQAVRLEIRLRDGGGTAVSGEVVTLQRLPEETPILPNCTTGADGVCIWHVERGLYQILFTRPLDEISTLELAESGLRGFGITVGDDAITYHFTLQSNRQIYFDAAPESILPVPIVPTFAAHEETTPTPVIELTTPEPTAAIELVPVEETAPSAGSGQAVPMTLPDQVGETAVNDTANPGWQLLVYIAIGLMLGGAIYAWPKAARRGSRIKQIHSPLTPSARSGQATHHSSLTTHHSPLSAEESDHA